ncbi:MAG: hypothetical protein AAFR61_06905 [Bacteroidota bacterium]
MSDAVAPVTLAKGSAFEKAKVMGCKVDIELVVEQAFPKPVHGYLVIFEHAYTIHSIAQPIIIRPDEHGPGSRINITPHQKAFGLSFNSTDPWGWVGIKVFISPMEINVDQFKQDEAAESSRAQNLLESDWQLPEIWTSRFLSFDVDLSKP